MDLQLPIHKDLTEIQKIIEQVQTIITQKNNSKKKRKN